MQTTEEIKARRVALRAKFFPDARPIARIPSAEEAAAATRAAEEARIEAERIERARARLDGCPTMPKPARLLLLSILEAHDLTFRAAFKRNSQGPSRPCRVAVMKALLEEGYSSTQIGNWFGLNHTTVLYTAGRMSKRKPPEGV